MSRFWSPIVEKLVPYTPGEQPGQRTVIKLNTNENPYGPSPLALQAIQAATGEGLRLYPDPVASELRDAIAGSFSLDVDHIHAGNGSDEVLAQAFNAFFTGKDAVVFPDITYSFYRTYCELYSIQAEKIPLDSAFRCDPKNYRGPCGGVVIANPNAPTGIAMPLEGIVQILQQNPDVVVIVDEAYVDFGAESAASLVPDFENLLVVQTFSKSRSLAGLRVGFAIGQPHLIEALQRVKDSFNSYPLGRLSLAGAVAAWMDREWFDRTRHLVMADREKTVTALEEQGFDVLPSSANFLFASHEKVSAEKLLRDLRARGILVRHFARERIGNHLRISIGTSEECAALLAATASIIRE
ncbi:histidinol-phosphate transaminase [Labrenzia sp. OB1]|uniref:histidinol-phosphate transaminase n=1 Tax=Labrenzia sp. OB1 TaxID=1561204 RepID=UPI0007B1A872|nr:histidinol-phosphate transaminase [Labrenzia sp. OB1]KZM49701.1 histidinol-phosphate aminotransferase [Labrenzia sp. OB1]